MNNIGGGFMTNNQGGNGGYGGGNFGGNGGYGGGNFGGFGGGYDNNQGSATKNGTSPYKGDKGQQKKGSIIPLTIKKLIEASNRPDDIVEVDGAPVDQAVIVGRVYKLEDQSTRTILHMDDSTGRIQVAYYKKGDGSGNGDIDNLYYRENMYVKVVVVVRPFKTQKMFISNLVQPVKDFNQVSYHLLSAFLASAYRTKGPLEKQDPTQQHPQQQSSQQMNSNNYQSNVGMNMSNNSNYQPMQMSNMASNDPQTIVKNTINQLQNQSTNGVCKQSKLQQMLRNKVNPQVILNCLQQLETNAEIYRDDDQQDPGFMLLGN